MRKLAPLLSLIVLGALGLVACGGDQTTAPSESEPTPDEIAGLAADNKSCGAFGRDHGPPWKLAVVEGDISCRVTRLVMHDWADERLPGSWSCTGPEAQVVCTKKPDSSRIVITARFAGEAVAVEDGPGNSNRLNDEERIEQWGNEWAAAFAAGRSTCGYMGQPACERATCERHLDGPIENCTPPSSEFRESFADATVERVVVSEDHHHATAEFSNGESVEFEGQKADEIDKGEGWGQWAFFITERWIRNAGGT